jgi:hypothetical protein
MPFVFITPPHNVKKPAVRNRMTGFFRTDYDSPEPERIFSSLLAVGRSKTVPARREPILKGEV